VKLGMLVRADFGRGLAYQTKSFYDNLEPDVTVVVDISPLDMRGKWAQDFTAYPGAIRSKWRGYSAPLTHEALDALAECDIVYSAETYYDDRLPSLTKTVLHVNPEFWRHQSATQYWYPTVWRTNDLPEGPIIPTPIEDKDIVFEVPGKAKILHVGGHRTLGDRNGSNVMGSVIQKVRHPWRVTSQDGMRLNPNVLGYTEVMGAVDDRWELFEGCGILVYPRRYGGQSLVVNEALAKGLVVLMPDCSPNIETWPIIPIPHRKGGFVQTPAGRLQMHMMQTQPLEATLSTLMNDEEQLARWQTRSVMWARDNSWSVWKPQIMEHLANAAS